MTITSPLGRTRGPHDGAVLKILRDHGPTSRTVLSGITDLSPTTITKAIAPLIEAGLLTESPDSGGGRGRRAITLTPVPGAVTVCGVQIGVGRIRLGLGDAISRIRSVRTYDFDPQEAPSAVLERLGAEIRDLLDGDDGAPCIGIGVGAPGPVDRDRRTNLLSINLGWTNVPISDTLEPIVGVPVVVDHNVRSFALGEAGYGGHGAASLGYLYIRTGVGLGIAVNGQPFYGGLGVGGESYLGHTRVADDGVRCSCGEVGCLETIVAEPYLREALSAIDGNSTSAQRDVMHDLHDRAAEGDRRAVALRETVIEQLSRSLSTVINLFTPELMLVGGTLATLPDEMLSDLRERTRARIFPLLRETLRLETADGGDAALVRGAAALGLEVLHYS